MEPQRAELPDTEARHGVSGPAKRLGQKAAVHRSDPSRSEPSRSETPRSEARQAGPAQPKRPAQTSVTHTSGPAARKGEASQHSPAGPAKKLAGDPGNKVAGSRRWPPAPPLDDDLDVMPLQGVEGGRTSPQAPFRASTVSGADDVGRAADLPEPSPAPELSEPVDADDDRPTRFRRAMAISR
jgi:hypothetical protein